MCITNPLYLPADVFLRCSNISGPFGGGSVVSAVDPSQPDEEGAGGTSVIYLAAGTEHG